MPTRILVAGIVAAGIAGLALVALPRPTRAEINYPWCTTGAGHEYGATNCGFSTFEQCLDSARGNGQMCQQNPFYQPPAASKREAKPKKPGNPR